MRTLLGEHSARSTGAEPAADQSAEAPVATGPGQLGGRAGIPPGLPVPWLRRVAARVPVRLDPGRRSAVAVGLAVVLAAVVTGIWLMSSRPQPMPVSAAVPAGSAPLAPASGASPTAAPTVAPAPSAAVSSPAELVVDVAGKVHRPGLYRLPAGARVDDALKAAGGPLGGVDLSSLNLAARVVDGQQIAVGKPGAVGPQPGAAGSSPAVPTGVGGASGPVDLNTASLEQLETLPGIGPALGQRILDWRSAHGSFTSVDQLDDVSGIGTVIFARLRALVTV